MALIDLASRRRPAPQRNRLIGIYGLLLAANLAAWGCAFAVFRDQPVLLGTALLAYGLGLRHAVDADHIAAIDNVTRTMRQAGGRPVTIGFYFALGHSSVVLLATMFIAGSAAILANRFDGLRLIGSIAGTTISAGFLLIVAIINAAILRSTWILFMRARRGEAVADATLPRLGTGLLARLLRPLFRMITASWHMLPLGFLFGLGFDTATEIGLLGLSATQAAQGMSTWCILVFPALFAAGMTLVDTTDGVLMLGVYDWAFIHPLRKLYYNLTITFVSIVVAILVGGVEILGMIGEQLDLDGPVWRVIGALNGNFGIMGGIIIAVFALAWAGSILVYRYAGMGHIDGAQS